jgi:hypothetical protein
MTRRSHIVGSDLRPLSQSGERDEKGGGGGGGNRVPRRRKQTGHCGGRCIVLEHADELP